MQPQDLLQLQPISDLTDQSLVALQHLPPVDLPLLAIHDPAARQIAREGFETSLDSVKWTLSKALAVRAQLEQVIGELSLRQDALLATNSLQAALPVEILIKIFDLVIWDSKDIFGPPMRPRLFLTHVCSRWRAICRACPSCWTTLTFSKREQSNMLDELLPLTVGRSLRLHTTGPPVQWPHDLEWKIELPQEAFERVIEMRFSDALYIHIFKLPEDVGCARVDRITFGSVKQYGILSLKCPATEFFPFASLRHVTLLGTESTNLDGLSHLEHLVMVGFNSVECAETLETVTTGSLFHLELRHFRARDPRYIPEPANIIPFRLSTQITQLTLRGFVPMCLREVLKPQALPHLTTLNLDRIPYELAQATHWVSLLAFLLATFLTHLCTPPIYTVQLW